MNKIKNHPILTIFILALLLSPLITQTALAANRPARVAKLTKGATTNGSINISWQEQANVSGYEVFRSEIYDGKYQKITTINPGNHTFCNMNLSSGKEYYYKVRAFNRTGNGPLNGKFSKILTASTRMTYPQTAATRVRSNLRKHAGTNQRIILTLNQGAKVTVLSQTKDKSGKGWTHITSTIQNKKYKGYIYSGLLKNLSNGTTTGTVTPGFLNVRSTTGTNGSILASLPRGQKVTIVKTITNVRGYVWYQISFNKNGRVMNGYVAASYIKL